eukprot:365801-Chlamydomonas_euryale.AAC.8
MERVLTGGCMHTRVDVMTRGWTHKWCTHEWMDTQVDGHTSGCTHKWMHLSGWTGLPADGRTDTAPALRLASMCVEGSFLSLCVERSFLSLCVEGSSLSYKMDGCAHVCGG